MFFPFISSTILFTLTTTTPSRSISPPLLDVLYANEHIAVVAKPPNMSCHRLEVMKGKRKRTIVQKDDDDVSVLDCAVETFPTAERVHLVHRLDAPTSGCLLIAFSSAAAREASKALFMGQKTYVALCRGNGDSLRQRGIFRAEGDVKDSRGKIKRGALTEIECLCGTDGPPRRCCLVRCQPHTGYWHQIRQHLAREHHPIVGENRHHPDRKENKFWRDELGLLPKSRVCLHCYRIVVKPPEGELCQFIPSEGLDVTCPFPNDLKSLIDLTDFSNKAQEMFS